MRCRQFVNADLRAAGYRIRLDFLRIPDLDITRNRVRQRVKKGGHDIPDDVQQRRFRVGIRHLAEHDRPLVDYWRLYDNTGREPHLVAHEKDGVLTIADAARLAFIELSANVRFMPATDPSTLQEQPAFTPDEETRRSLRAMRRAYARVVLEVDGDPLPRRRARPPLPSQNLSPPVARSACPCCCDRQSPPCHP